MAVEGNTMVEAYRCNSCDVYHDGDPAVKATFRSPGSEAMPPGLAHKADNQAHFCADCWETMIDAYAFARAD